MNQQGRPREKRGHRVVGPVQTPNFERHWAATTTAIVMTAISIAMSVAAAAASYMQQQAQAQAQARNQKAMMDAQDAAIKQNAALANADYMNKTKTLQERQRQEDEAAVYREMDVASQAAQARSTAITAAGEAGVGGLSVNALLSEYAMQEADYRFQSRTNLENTREQTGRELEAASIQGAGRINAMQPYQPKPAEYPSLLGAALRVGADASGAIYNNHFKNRPSSPSSPSTGGGVRYGDNNYWG